MKVRIKETGEIVEVEYDDLYVVLGRHQYLYANEFDIVTLLSDDAAISISKLRDILEDVASSLFEPRRLNDATIDEIINRVKESI